MGGGVKRLEQLSDLSVASKPFDTVRLLLTAGVETEAHETLQRRAQLTFYAN